VLERYVLLQDGALGAPQLRARFDAQLVQQQPAGRPVDRQRLRLPPAAVQGDHQLLVQPLAQGVSGGQRLQLTDQIRVPAEREIGFDTVLEDPGPQLLQPRDLRVRERFIADVGQRRTAPQRQRLPEDRRRPARRARIGTRR